MTILAPILLLAAAALIAGGASAAPAEAKSSADRGAEKIDPFLIADRSAEIELARSAAPKSISADAEVLVLGRNGYETAVKGSNGFVCLVERSWMKPFDDPEFWNPDVLAPLCVNAPAARTHLPLTFKTTELVLAGRSKAQIYSAIKLEYEANRLPAPEIGSMCYMMSKHQNFGPKYGAADPHLMFWFPKRDKVNWGGYPGSPIDLHQYDPQPITEFDISVSKWSDGTPAPSM
jgi:hypothetical protein